MKLREFVDTYDKEFENNPSKRKKTNAASVFAAVPDFGSQAGARRCRLSPESNCAPSGA